MGAVVVSVDSPRTMVIASVQGRGDGGGHDHVVGRKDPYATKTECYKDANGRCVQAVNDEEPVTVLTTRTESGDRLTDEN